MENFSIFGALWKTVRKTAVFPLLVDSLASVSEKECRAISIGGIQIFDDLEHLCHRSTGC
jgi:hypothetical protein